MDLQTVAQLISTVGFPIVACWYLATSNDKMREIITENTKTIAELKDLLLVYLRKEYVNKESEEE